MAKSLDEFREELRALRDEMYQSSDTADLKLVASYLDRLVMSLEGLSETLEAMENEVECSCECCSVEEMPPKPKAAKKPQKKAAKKKKRR